MPQSSTEELVARLRAVLADMERLVAGIDDPPSEVQQAALERWLQLSIQVCMDIGDRILAARNIDEPTQMRDIFLVLARHGVLDKERALQMRRLADLRNALVHAYDEFTPHSTIAQVRTAIPLLKSVGDVLAGAI